MHHLKKHLCKRAIIFLFALFLALGIFSTVSAQTPAACSVTPQTIYIGSAPFFTSTGDYSSLQYPITWHFSGFCTSSGRLTSPRQIPPCYGVASKSVGSFDEHLTVTEANGAVHASDNCSVTVSNITISLTAYPMAPQLGGTVTFSAISLPDDRQFSYIWSEPICPSTSNTCTVTMDNPSYTISVHARDNLGNVSATQTLTVTAVAGTPTPAPGPGCNDSDGGFDPYISGTTTGTDTYNNTYTGTDVCVDSYNLLEYTCGTDLTINGGLLENTYFCPTGCLNGACNLGAPPTITINSPIQGDQWIVGDDYVVSWSCPDCTAGSYIIGGLYDNSTRQPVDSSININTDDLMGSYDFIIANLDSGSYYLRLFNSPSPTDFNNVITQADSGTINLTSAPSLTPVQSDILSVQDASLQYISASNGYYAFCGSSAVANIKNDVNGNNFSFDCKDGANSAGCWDGGNPLTSSFYALACNNNDPTDCYCTDRSGQFYSGTASSFATPISSNCVCYIFPVTGVSLNKNSETLYVGNTDQLTATVLPSDATDQNVNWSSSNASIASVDVNGLVRALALGSATITAATVNGNYTSTDVVTVMANPQSGAYSEIMALQSAASQYYMLNNSYYAFCYSDAANNIKNIMMGVGGTYACGDGDTATACWKGSMDASKNNWYGLLCNNSNDCYCVDSTPMGSFPSSGTYNSFIMATSGNCTCH